MKFGVAYEYWSTEWVCDYKATAKKIRDIGFDVIEISADHLYHMSDEEIDDLKKYGEEIGIEFSTNSGPAKEYDLASVDPAVRKNGIEYFKKIFIKMNRLGSRILVGAIYSYWPCSFDNVDKAGCWERSIESLKALAPFAEENDIECALEVLNRNETYILTDCAEAIEYCNRIGSKNIDILLDTYHMNIEEDDMFDAIRRAGKQLGHLHVGENNRKLPGMNNNINWAEIGRALRDINYDKYVVMEPFLLSGGAVGHDVRVWRDLSNNATVEEMDKMLKDSLVFLKKACLGQ